MTHFGEHWAGVCLAGEYTLESYISGATEGRSDAALFAARRDGEPVLVKLTDAEDSSRLALWKHTIHLQHPNLLQMLDCGKDEASPGGGCYYAVFEWPDDQLGTALEQGPLGEGDARELLLSMLGALRYLHAQGLVHGSIAASRVMAVGSAIKLATDDLHEPDGEFTYAGDIYGLGALLYHVMTGRQYAAGADLRDLPEGYRKIVRNTAGVRPEDRWRIPEILAAVPEAPPVVEPPPPEPEPVPQPAAVEPQAVAPAAANSLNETTAPSNTPKPGPAAVPVPLPLERPAREFTRPVYNQKPPQSIPRWAWPAAIVTVVGVLFWVFHTPAPKNEPVVKRVESAPAQKTAPVVAPPPAVAPPVRRPEPDQTKPKPFEAASSTTPERPVWRVIAYTYNAFRDAEKRVMSINQKWPGLQAEVFAPKGKNRGPYLVALGGRMNRLEAARVLQKARTRGLPRDTFMLNFSD